MSGRPSPVIAEVGTIFTNLRRSLFCQYSATFSPARRAASDPQSGRGSAGGQPVGREAVRAVPEQA